MATLFNNINAVSNP